MNLHCINLNYLAKVVYEKRDHEGLSLRAAAKQIGVSSATIHRVEDGKMLDVCSLVLITDWLEITIDSLTL